MDLQVLCHIMFPEVLIAPAASQLVSAAASHKGLEGLEMTRLTLPTMIASDHPLRSAHLLE